MTRWPLPDQPHVPGRTPRPTQSPAFDAAQGAPVYTVDKMWAQNETYLYGIALYNAAFFWEAHEVWEPVWMRAMGNSRERLLMQALIQLANACLKIEMERPKAALRLLDIAGQRCADAACGGPSLMGLSLTTLEASIASFTTSVHAANPESATELLCEKPLLAPCPN
ncbi:MAG: DUF309 domain-containing protein [Paracoccaceae bacterium]